MKSVFAGMVLLLSSFAAGAPTASIYQGYATINELAFTANDIDYVEIYFSQSTIVTNWSLISNVPSNASNGAVDGNCSLPNGNYAAGEFLVISANCLSYHPNQREYYITDRDGNLVHHVSQWTTGEQNVQGDFGAPDNWPSSLQALTTNLNSEPPDASNYCALTDGDTVEPGWSSGCNGSQATSNTSINTPSCGQVFTDTVSAQTSITFLDNSYVDNGADTQLTALVVNNNTSQLSCLTSACSASGSGAARAGLPQFKQASTTGEVTASGTQVIAHQAQFNLIQITGDSTTSVQFANSGNDWIINALSVGSATTLVFSPGDYYINSLTIGSAANLAVSGNGLVRLFVWDDVDFGEQVSVNMLGNQQPGNSGNLFIASYSDYYQGRGSQVSANIYARNQANMGSAKTVGGNNSLATWHYGAVSANTVEYSNNMRSLATGDATNTGGICDGTPNSQLTELVHWTFDEGQTSFPSAGGASVESLTGVTRTNAGKVCSALNFDGTAQSTPAAQTSFDVSQAIPVGSFALWIQPTEFRQAPLFFSYASDQFYAVFTTNNNSDNHSNDGVIQVGIPRVGNNAPAPFYAEHGLSNQDMLDWHHIAVSWNIPEQRYRIWLNGVLLTTTYTAPAFTPRDNISLAFSSGDDQFLLDEVHFYQGEIDQATINQLINASRNCPDDIDDIRIVHDGNAITCASEPVTFEVWQNGQLKSNYNGTLDISVAGNSGRWFDQNDQQIHAGNNGRASIQFNGTEGGRTTLFLQQNQTGTYNINATDGVVSETTYDPQLTYRDTALRWVDGSGAAIHPGNANQVLTAGDRGDIGLEIITTDTQTKACQTIFPENGQLALTLASECLDPSQCQTQLELGQGGLSPIANPQQLDAGQPSSQQTWQLNADSLAVGQVRFQDVGQVRLSAQTQLPLPDGSGNDTTINASVDLTFQPASLRLVDIEDNQGTSTENANGMIAAMPWRGRVEALTSTGQVAINFGQEQTPPRITSSVRLLTPVDGLLGNWQAPTNWQAASPSGLEPVAGEWLRYDEVGSIELTLGIHGGYLNSPWQASTNQPLGRFLPSYLDASTTVIIDELCVNDLAADFVYLGQPVSVSELTIAVRGYNANNQISQNYGLAGELAPPSNLPTWQAGVSTETSGSWQSTAVAGGVDWQLIGTRVQWQRQLQLPTLQALQVNLDASTLTDSDGVCKTDGTACIGLSAASNTLAHYFGKLALLAATGSELSSQQVPAVWQALAYQEVNGAPAWQVLTADQCSPAPATRFASDGVCQGFSASECLSLAVAQQSRGSVNGSGSYVFVGNNSIGQVEVELVTEPWLQTDLNDDGVFSENSRALIGFGIWRGQAPILYKLPAWR